MSNCCCMCMKPLDGTDWLCHVCAEKHEVSGTPFKDWPDYVKAMADEEQQARRRDEERRDAGFSEVTFTDCPRAEALAYGDNPDPQFASAD